MFTRSELGSDGLSPCPSSLSSPGDSQYGSSLNFLNDDLISQPLIDFDEAECLAVIDDFDRKNPTLDSINDDYEMTSLDHHGYIEEGDDEPSPSTKYYVIKQEPMVRPVATSLSFNRTTLSKFGISGDSWRSRKLDFWKFWFLRWNHFYNNFFKKDGFRAKKKTTIITKSKFVGFSITLIFGSRLELLRIMIKLMFMFLFLETVYPVRTIVSSRQPASSPSDDESKQGIPTLCRTRSKMHDLAVKNRLITDQVNNFYFKIYAFLREEIDWERVYYWMFHSLFFRRDIIGLDFNQKYIFESKYLSRRKKREENVIAKKMNRNINKGEPERFGRVIKVKKKKWKHPWIWIPARN